MEWMQRAARGNTATQTPKGKKMKSIMALLLFVAFISGSAWCMADAEAVTFHGDRPGVLGSISFTGQTAATINLTMDLIPTQMVAVNTETDDDGTMMAVYTVTTSGMADAGTVTGRIPIYAGPIFAIAF